MRISKLLEQNNQHQTFGALNFIKDAKSRIIANDSVVKEQVDTFVKQLEGTKRFDLNVAPLEGSKDKVRFFWTEKESGKPFLNCAFNTILSPIGSSIILKPLAQTKKFKSLILRYSSPLYENDYSKNLTYEHAFYIMKGFDRKQAVRLVELKSGNTSYGNQWFNKELKKFTDEKPTTSIGMLERKVHQTLTIESAASFEVNK